MSLITVKDYSTSLAVPKSSEFACYLACTRPILLTFSTFCALMLHLTAQAVTHQSVRDHEDVATHGEDGFMLRHKEILLGKKKREN